MFVLSRVKLNNLYELTAVGTKTSDRVPKQQ